MINKRLHSVSPRYSACSRTHRESNNRLVPRQNQQATQQQQPRGAHLFPSNCPAPSLAPTAGTSAAAASSAAAAAASIGSTAAAAFSIPDDPAVSPNDDNIFEAELSAAMQNSLHDLGPAVKRPRVPPHLSNVNLSPIMPTIQNNPLRAMMEDAADDEDIANMRDRTLSRTFDEATDIIDVDNPTQASNQESAVRRLNWMMDRPDKVDTIIRLCKDKDPDIASPEIIRAFDRFGYK